MSADQPDAFNRAILADEHRQFHGAVMCAWIASFG
jgi:hypothetical protein